jgi:hypothetical protein
VYPLMLRNLALLVGLWLIPVASPAVERPAGFSQPAWLTDYGKGMAVAREEKRMLLVYFRSDDNVKSHEVIDRALLQDKDVGKALSRYTRVVVPLEVKVKGKSTQLIKHSAFRYMHGRMGLVVIDLANADASYYGHVVSELPVGGPYKVDRQRLLTMLGLPAGTLTQRTLIFAVRSHAEKPASTNGHFDKVLARESESHSQHQASITRQGHHNWNARFHRITSQLPKGAAKEVCAESWPGQDLLEAAKECVHSWRQSPGHWSAVRTAHSHYGYDMKRGRNGVWYATGIFAASP